MLVFQQLKARYRQHSVPDIQPIIKIERTIVIFKWIKNLENKRIVIWLIRLFL